MTYQAQINIMPLKELLDPQGRAATRSLSEVHIDGVEDIRIGKHVHMTLTADDDTKARETVETACKKLLANPIMESYSYELQAVE